METKFQTSFIPKRPILSESKIATHHSVSIFMTIGVLIFIVSLAGAGFTFFWNSVLISTQKSYQDTLVKNENQFNPQLIDTLRHVNAKIDASKQLITNHLAVSQIFDIIGALTANNITFKNLSYDGPTTNAAAGGSSGSSAGNMAQISMQGAGSSFSAIAFQSDVFGQSSQYGRNIVVKNPVLSSLTLDSTGQVLFSFTASIDPANISYTKYLAQSLGGTGATGVTSGRTNPNQ